MIDNDHGSGEGDLTPDQDTTPDLVIDGDETDVAVEPVPDPTAVTDDADTDETDAEPLLTVNLERTAGDDEDDMQVAYQTDHIDLRGESDAALAGLMKAELDILGAEALNARVREIGTWENIIFRSIDSPNYEEMRIQEALGKLKAQGEDAPQSVYRDPDTNAVKLKTAAIISRKGTAGETRTLAGSEALMAFDTIKSVKGGGYRVPLYNSGITIDVRIPTGKDIQTLLTNCLLFDREFGASQGAHYFIYADLLYKTQILNFIHPLIVNSSYDGWRKNGKIWSVIKITDLPALVMTIAALCYKDGFDNFTTRCTRPRSESHPDGCHHTETFKANLFNLIVTRFSVMSRASIDFMVAARMNKERNSITQISKYQAGLGLEGEKITREGVSFVMRIPSISEYQQAGAKFLSDIVNEVQADNSDGHYEQLGFRYIRTFLPWIASMEAEGDHGDNLVTTDSNVIQHILERLSDRDNDGTLANALRDYVGKVQLTYVGHPALPCPSCGHTADTPSGMLTLDPFSTFFTLAFLYLRPKESTIPES